ncbi:hypothetical protein [Marinigracilibium pacificum]|uniref:Uncharacterized protein n=1 Tax=Marinigracilibium pacificum TaxID=2729599 RepID=A0A848IXM2_9BACT|nr:hypothetical protein [Marinigracilibium pacificum]NMM47918.1 hypothetical protein [Marinigracilibium pacificum]
MKDQTDLEIKLRKILSWTAVFGTLIFALVFFGRIAFLAVDENYWKGIGLKHFPTIVGLPAAAIAAIVIVLALRTVAGPLEFKFFGLEFKGASGPTAFWVVCFLAITLAIRITWDLSFDFEN